MGEVEMEKGEGGRVENMGEFVVRVGDDELECSEVVTSISFSRGRGRNGGEGMVWRSG